MSRVQKFPSSQLHNGSGERWGEGVGGWVAETEVFLKKKKKKKSE
jgi:hypothetical protein